MSELLPPTSSQVRINIAERLNLETIGTQQFTASPEQFPWLSETRTINTSIVKSPSGTFEFGSIIAASHVMREIAERQMENQEREDDRLNRLMYGCIQKIIDGNPGSVKRMLHAPMGIPVYYEQTRTGGRVFFTDAGKGETGQRIFLKVAVCPTKAHEPNIMGAISGRKERRGRSGKQW